MLCTCFFTVYMYIHVHTRLYSLSPLPPPPSLLPPPSSIFPPPAHVYENEHSRAVNKLSFHPKEPSMLLSGSQDSTMKIFVCKYNYYAGPTHFKLHECKMWEALKPKAKATCTYKMSCICTLYIHATAENTCTFERCAQNMHVRF